LFFWTYGTDLFDDLGILDLTELANFIVREAPSVAWAPAKPFALEINHAFFVNH
jgi:hypothetical protein